MRTGIPLHSRAQHEVLRTMPETSFHTHFTTLPVPIYPLAAMKKFYKEASIKHDDGVCANSNLHGAPHPAFDEFDIPCT